MLLPNNFPNDKIEELREKIRTQEGSLVFHITLSNIYNTFSQNLRIIEIETGKIIFILEKDTEENFKFYHSSPGTGTRYALINIEKFKPNEEFMIIMMWSPSKIKLAVGTIGNNNLELVEGKISNVRFALTNDGSIFQSGNEEIKILQMELYEERKLVFKNFAIETWKNVIDATKVLMRGGSPENELRYEPVVVNMIIVMLVTGYESYCKTRFSELEEEGNIVDFTSLTSAFLSKNEKDNNYIQTIINDAIIDNLTPTQKFISNGRIDFQNYKRAKTAFKKAFGISFTEDLLIEQKKLEELQRYIKIRHRIVHVSLFLGQFNPEEYKEEPIFPNFTLANHIIDIFDLFINRLHEQTLNIYKKNK